MGRGEATWGERAAALAGAGAWVLMVVGTTLSDTSARGASPNQSGERLANIMAGQMAQSRVGAALLPGAAVLQLIFAAVLWDRLRVGPPAQWPAALALGGGIMGAVLVTITAEGALAQYTAGDFRDTATSRMLVTTGWEAATLWVAPSLTLVTAGAVAGFRGAMPRWFAVLSAVGAVALVVALAVPVLPAGMLAVAASAWALPASAVLFRQTGKVPEVSG